MARNSTLAAAAAPRESFEARARTAHAAARTSRPRAGPVARTRTVSTSRRRLPPARGAADDRLSPDPVEPVHPDDRLVDLLRLRVGVVGVVDEPCPVVAVAHDRLVPRPRCLAAALHERVLGPLPARPERPPAPRVADRVEVAGEVAPGVEEVIPPVFPPHRRRLDDLCLPHLVVLDQPCSAPDQPRPVRCEPLHPDVRVLAAAVAVVLPEEVELAVLVAERTRVDRAAVLLLADERGVPTVDERALG